MTVYGLYCEAPLLMDGTYVRVQESWSLMVLLPVLLVITAHM
jgi:hypothetical protein